MMPCTECGAPMVKVPCPDSKPGDIETCTVAHFACPNCPPGMTEDRLEEIRAELDLDIISPIYRQDVSELLEEVRRLKAHVARLEEKGTTS